VYRIAREPAAQWQRRSNLGPIGMFAMRPPTRLTESNLLDMTNILISSA